MISRRYAGNRLSPCRRPAAFRKLGNFLGLQAFFAEIFTCPYLTLEKHSRMPIRVHHFGRTHDHLLDHAPAQANSLRQFLVLTLGSVGVVYGDIGTSPLYAFREALRPFSEGGVAREEVVGLISLMIWTLTMIVTCKYVLFLLRADNDGEGGTLSLLALLMKRAPRYTTAMFVAGILGAALFIGDAMITPALSVLSAVED